MLKRTLLISVLALLFTLPFTVWGQDVGMEDKEPTFNLSEEDFLKGNFRIIEGIKAGKKPITLGAAELVRIHGEVVGIIKGKEALIKRTIEKKVGGVLYIQMQFLPVMFILQILKKMEKFL